MVADSLNVQIRHVHNIRWRYILVNATDVEQA